MKITWPFGQRLSGRQPQKPGASVLILWTGAGFACWILATYPLRTLTLPLAAQVTRSLSHIGFLAQVLPLAGIVISHIPAFVLSFGGCMILGYLSEATFARVICFVSGATAVSLAYHVRQAAGLLFSGAYSVFPALTWIVTGLASLLVIVPVFAVLGSRAGSAFKHRPF